MHLNRRERRIVTALLPIPIAAGITALLLLAGCGGTAQSASGDDVRAATTTTPIRVGHGDSHDESAGARRLPGALGFLLGPRAALP